MKDSVETACVTDAAVPSVAATKAEVTSPVPIQVKIPAAAEYVKVVREVVDCLCQLRTLSEDTRAAIKLAVGEAVNNAVLYARAKESAPEVEVAISLQDNLLEIDIANESEGFHPDATSKMPDAELLAERGRGLALMNIMMDEVEYLTRGTQTVVRLRKWID